MTDREELLQRKKEIENKLNILEKELQNPFLKRELREKYSKAVDFLERDLKAIGDKILVTSVQEEGNTITSVAAVPKKDIKAPEGKAPPVADIQEKENNVTEKGKLLQRKKETENKLNTLEMELQNPFLKKDLREKCKKVVAVLEKDLKALGDKILIASAREEGLVE